MTGWSDPIPSSYTRSVGVIGRVTTPTRSLSANQAPRNKPKRKTDKTFAAPCTLITVSLNVLIVQKV